MARKSSTILAVGDVILEKPNGEFFLSLAAPMLKTGNVVVGNGEVVFTSRGINTFIEMFPSPGCPPENIGALASAGFNVITLAGNHVWDRGAPGIEDTISGCRDYGIATVGAGMNIDEARKPAIIERNGMRFGFLNYNCVGVMGQWATIAKPGCAYVHVITHYEINGANPGGAPGVYTFAEPNSLRTMVNDIQKLRPLCDILVVALHKGILHSTDIAMYEQQVSYAAVEAGADLIFSHHAHYLKGIEFYKGKVIFHGLGHFVAALAGLTEKQIIEKRSLDAPKLSGVINHQHDPLGSMTIIAKCIVEDGNISQLSYYPCLINKQGQPEVLKNDERGRHVFDFMEKATREAGLNARYKWEGDEIVIHAV